MIGVDAWNQAKPTYVYNKLISTLLVHLASRIWSLSNQKYVRNWN